MSESTQVRAMRWGTQPQMVGSAQTDAGIAKMIVAWVNANGGEARYETHAHTPVDGCPNGPVIAVRTINGWAYAAPGDYVVMGTATFDSDTYFKDGDSALCRDFYVQSHAPEAEQWHQADEIEAAAMAKPLSAPEPVEPPFGGLMAEQVQPGCCSACGGRGGTAQDGPCPDCYATGHCHPTNQPCEE